jgi:tRNA threonylcarbamoyl adenosine modification protein (Sua5/YciO/YrdC/YwlC family)
MLLMNQPNDPRILAELKNGAVGVLPTDTVYGLVCRATDKKAVSRLYQLKSRESKPGTVIAASAEQLIELGIPARYLKPLAHFWPNRISIIVPSTPALAYLDLGKMSVAVRIPADDVLLALLKQAGPLLTSSANQPGSPTAETPAEAKSYFGDQVDFYVDGGDLSGRPPSTIIKVIDDEVVVLREGAIKLNDKGEIVDDI